MERQKHQCAQGVLPSFAIPNLGGLLFHQVNTLHLTCSNALKLELMFARYKCQKSGQTCQPMGPSFNIQLAVPPPLQRKRGEGSAKDPQSRTGDVL